jgi:hypothetical protein
VFAMKTGRALLVAATNLPSRTLNWLRDLPVCVPKTLNPTIVVMKPAEDWV